MLPYVLIVVEADFSSFSSFSAFQLSQSCEDPRSSSMLISPMYTTEAGELKVWDSSSCISLQNETVFFVLCTVGTFKLLFKQELLSSGGGSAPVGLRLSRSGLRFLGILIDLRAEG